LRKVRLDNNVKAVVFRVNSPGGSSLASDVIWREVMLTKRQNPLLCLWVTMQLREVTIFPCAADSIIAEPNTITGSIGIFCYSANMQKFFNDKLGITFDGVKTGKYADLGDISRPLTPKKGRSCKTRWTMAMMILTKAVANGRS